MRFSSAGFRLATSDPGETTNPRISNQLLLSQFWLDIFGKEVQSAATYSYMWLADQVGHLFIGLLLDFALTFALGWLIPDWSVIAGLLLAVIIVSVWEFLAYRKDMKTATYPSLLDEPLLRKNAIIAAGYMWMGAVIGFGFHQSVPWNIILFLAVLCIAVLCARSWLQQKIIWQKAALPYLFRLANAKTTISKVDAKKLQEFIADKAPPDVTARQVVIGGPIGSGRTSLATGIGTEFAFKKVKVRYLSLDALLEFSSYIDSTPPPPPRFGDDPGPRNISYWPWDEAQVLIIDDIGPVISSQRDKAHFDHFRHILQTELSRIAVALSRRHTIWICGDLGGGESTLTNDQLHEFAAAIAELCKSTAEQLIIRLQPDTQAPRTKRRFTGRGQNLGPQR